MSKRQPSARTPEERENQLINKAYDLVEKRMDEGSASSQETTHFLKLASSRSKLEEARLQEEVKLLKVKTDAIAAQGELRGLVVEALEAMRAYKGAADPEERPPG